MSADAAMKVNVRELFFAWCNTGNWHGTESMLAAFEAGRASMSAADARDAARYRQWIEIWFGGTDDEFDSMLTAARSREDVGKLMDERISAQAAAGEGKL